MVKSCELDENLKNTSDFQFWEENGYHVQMVRFKGLRCWNLSTSRFIASSKLFTKLFTLFGFKQVPHSTLAPITSCEK
jgi:hypothetical protein